MNTDLCQATCAGNDQRAFRFAMRQTVHVICAHHAALLTSQGMTLIEVERRSVDLPVAVNRRHSVARWLRNLTARDETWAA